VSIPNGLPRPFSLLEATVPKVIQLMFQSRTGFPGHLAHVCIESVNHVVQFQSRTGFPGHLAVHKAHGLYEPALVSISHGLIKPLVERCAGLRSEKRSLRPALNSCAYTIKTEVSLGGGPPTVSTRLTQLAHKG